MLKPLDATDQRPVKSNSIQHAVALLSQQIWCWGRDIQRPEGNWLLQIGFDRQAPPSDRDDCCSLYTLDLPRERCVVLRGFGVFYGDQEHGGIYLPRFEFRPRYTLQTTLDDPPWSTEDLPKLDPPTESQRNACIAMTVELIDWIRDYEVDIAQRLGVEYRRSTLERWDNGKRIVTPAEHFASEWQKLSAQVATNFTAFLD